MTTKYIHTYIYVYIRLRPGWHGGAVVSTMYKGEPEWLFVSLWWPGDSLC